jgi:hypothetical protein
MKKAVYLSVCIILASCKSDVIEPVIPPPPDNVSFNDNIIPIFNLSCNNPPCHAPGGKSPDLSPAVAYDNLMLYGLVDVDDPAGSGIYTKIAPGGSMATYAKPGDAELILKWIEQGAENN